MQEPWRHRKPLRADYRPQTDVRRAASTRRTLLLAAERTTKPAVRRGKARIGRRNDQAAARGLELRHIKWAIVVSAELAEVSADRRSGDSRDSPISTCYETSVDINMSRRIRTQAAAALIMARKTGVLRASEVREQGISPTVLTRLVTDGKLTRVGRGLYALPGGRSASENRSVVEAVKRVPHGVVCLLTALRVHELGTQAPFEVWLAIDEKARKPRVESPPLRIVRFSGAALTQGVERRRMEGVEVPIYTPAKTVADCFKYRNKLGLDVALEALREYLREFRTGREELRRYAKVCRVEQVMRPYVEAMSS